jgi:tRNA (guanine-N7-)-methyltransferase
MLEERGQRRAFQFYGRRKGRRLTESRRSLFDTLLPQLTVTVPGKAGHAGTVLDPRTLFDAPREVWLEIGFGGGEHLAAQAAANPDIGFVGCEVFDGGIASALGHIADGDLKNVRFYPEDARNLLAVLAPDSIDRVFLLFPDPWPKRRHEQRRFIGKANLDRLATLMRDGAELRVASDDPTYQEWVLRHVPVHPAFHWQVQSPSDWLERPTDAIETRYEKKARVAGRTPMFFRFLKI